MKTSFFFILFLMTFFACNEKAEKVYFPLDKSIYAETVPIQFVMSPDFLTVKNDFLIVATNREDTMLLFYETPDLKLISSAGRKGQGGDDFQAFPMFCESNTDNLYIWGYTIQTIKKHDTTEEGKLIPDETFNLNIFDSCNQLHVIDDSLLVYYAHPNELSIKKYDLKSNTEINKIIPGKDNTIDDPFLAEDKGHLAVSGSAIIYAYTYKKQIDIYDLHSLTLRKRIEYDYKWETPTRDRKGKSGHNTIFYNGVYAGRDCFYAIYQGSSLDEKKETVIEVYDYEGNPIKRLQTDKFLARFAVDENKGKLYGYNFENEDIFFLFNL